MASSIVHVDLFSFSDLRGVGSLTAIGRAFDADLRLRPERMDTRDPIRVKIERAEDYMEGIESTAPRPLRVAFQRRTRPEYVGDVDVRDETSPSMPGPRRLWFATGELTWLEDPVHAAGFAELVVRLAGAFEASYGFATHSKLPWQQQVEFQAAASRGEPATPIPGPYTDRRSLRDVYWLNVFGPAFVDRFGSRLDSLGVRQERTTNGGVVVWAAETPFLYDETIGSHRDYSWKRAFYEALGPDAFVHPNQRSTDNVPSWDDHRRFLSRA